MSTLVRWEPFGEGVTLRDAVDRLFDEALITPRWFTPFRETFTGSLAVDLFETTNELVVQVSVPGFKPEEIDISVVGDMLTIKGEVKEEKKEEQANYLLQERKYGFVHRTLHLPMPVIADKANATFENGVLTLTLPKVEEVKPKQIKIMMNGGKK